MAEPRYRLHDGKIETQAVRGEWIVSAHDAATADEVADYEADKHPVAHLLRAKFEAQP